MLIKHFFNMFYKLYLELSKLVYNYIEALNYIIKFIDLKEDLLKISKK